MLHIAALESLYPFHTWYQPGYRRIIRLGQAFPSAIRRRIVLQELTNQARVLIFQLTLCIKDVNHIPSPLHPVPLSQDHVTSESEGTYQ